MATLKVGAAGVLAPKVMPCPSAKAEDKAATGWQIGCYTRPWAAYEYPVALDAIAEAGYKYAGLMSTKSESKLVLTSATSPEEAQRIGEEVRKRGMAIPSVYGGGIPVAQSLQAAIDALRKLIDNCVAARAANLLMGGMGNEKLYAVYYQAIAECCDYAAEKGVGISVKPHGGLNANGTQCRKAVETVGHANFRLWYDPGNIYFYSDGALDPVVDAAAVDGLVAGMCVKDFKPPKNVAVTPGTGQVNFAAVLSRLKQGGFTQGALVVETLTPGDLPQTLEEARKARQFIEGIVKQVG